MLFAVGSYTVSRGSGISIYQWDDSLNSSRLVSSSKDIPNPSYLDWDPASRRLYAVSEIADAAGAVAVFNLSDEGILSFSGKREGPGRDACHLKVLHNSGQPGQPDRPGRSDMSGKPDRLYAVSYGEGRLGIYPLNSGDIAPLQYLHPYPGHGIEPQRQASSHAHQVLPGPGGRYLYVTDLGCDTIWMHSAETPGKAPAVALKTPPGYGPRHLAFDKDGEHVYILCELRPYLLVCSLNPESGEMTILKELETASAEGMKKAAPAAVKIHPSGRTLAVSNRFDDTIAVFSISSEGLSLADRFSCRGKTPRDISFSADGTRLFIANQDSHNISCRSFEERSGLPLDNWYEEISTGSPVCIVMLGD